MPCNWWHSLNTFPPIQSGSDTETMKFSVQNSSSYCVDEKKACIRWVERYFRDCLCNIRDELSFGFGLISLVCWGVAEIPQIITNFRTQSAHGVSLLLLLTWILGDIFNLVGCLLEPATLPTQLYTAALYTASAMILVLQSLYYGRNCQEKEPNQEVDEEAKTPLILSKPTDSAITIPNGTHSSAAASEVYSYMSARYMAGSTTPPIRSYPWPVNSSPPAVRINNDTSSDNEANPMPAKKYVNKPKSIPQSVGFAAFIAASINKPCVTLALMKVHVELQEHGIEIAYGQWSGWMMAAIYMGGRIPQIWLNIKRGTVEGLNPLMFVLGLVANATYVASILVRSIAWEKIKSNAPWLMDAVGCMVLDVFILLQFVYYRYFRKTCCGREDYIEYGHYIEANKD